MTFKTLPANTPPLALPELFISQEDQHDIDVLMQMHAYCRPDGSKAEAAFIKRYIAPTGAHADAMGNLILRIGTAPMLFSCHTDTVHMQDGKQATVFADWQLALAANTESNCLGADCTAGVWLMLQMIAARIEGLYIFHAAEECGGLGSSHIASETPDLLAGIRHAIAFDRRGTSSVITRQAGAVCCSDTFATALCKLLPHYKPDHTGIFTDTANYVGLIPECTNISVGYVNEHTSGELLDVSHLLNLRDALLCADFASLPIERQCDAPRIHNLYRDNWDMGYPARSGLASHAGDIVDIIRRYPEHIAEMLESMGYDVDSLIKEMDMLHAGL